MPNPGEGKGKAGRILGGKGPVKKTREEKREGDPQRKKK